MSTDEEKKLWKEQAARLRKARKAAGFEKAKAAAKAYGVSEGTWNPWENGGRSFKSQADEISKFLGVSRAWLMEGAPDTYLEDIYNALRDVPADQKETIAAAAIGVIEQLKRRA